MISEHPDDIVLLDYVEGMLQGQASDSVRRHIATCRACRRTLAELSDTVSELERLPTAEIPHDALGRPGRAGMLRALARFVPVLLAATALVFAILFTRGGGGRRHASSVRTAATLAALRLPPSVGVAMIVKKLKRAKLKAVVNRPQWSEGFIVIVPSGKRQSARIALDDLAADKCVGQAAEACLPVALYTAPPRADVEATGTPAATG
jgi:anti-sigma factor RsiW